MKPKIRKLTEEEIASGRYASTRGGQLPVGAERAGRPLLPLHLGGGPHLPRAE
jgi:hypothetical protein